MCVCWCGVWGRCCCVECVYGWFQRLLPARGGTAQKKILHLANWSQLIHPGPASSLTKFFLVSSQSCVSTLTHFSSELLLRRHQELSCCEAPVCTDVAWFAEHPVFGFLIVVVREYIVVYGSVYFLVRYCAVFQYSVVSLELNVRIYCVCVQVLETFFLTCAEYWNNS